MECSVNHANLNLKFCPSCGASISSQSAQQNIRSESSWVPTNPVPAPQVQNFIPATPAPSPNTNTLAIVGFVTSIICCGTAIGIVCSAIALGQINKNPNQGGKGLATAGLVLGILGTVGVVFYWIVTALGSTGY